MAQKYRRSLKNYLIDPNFQIKYAFYFAASGVAMMGVLFSMITYRLNQTMTEMASGAFDMMALESALSTIIYDVSFFCVIAFFLNIVFSFSFALFMTHRVAGASYVIENYIKELKAGDYSSDRTLRKSDDLQAIMVALRDLAAHLKLQK